MVKRSKTIEEMTVVHPNAAGLDIGASEIWGCLPADREGERIKAFGTFTPDLQRLADWLLANEIDTVAMESTGVYWIPVFELLEARGLRVYLVNARHIKTVPGRKSDYQDCQWLQKLHMLGLLSASFRPDGEIVCLRGYLRHRAQLIQHRAPHLLHMHQALAQMNIQLSQVLTDIGGTTGFAILRAIVAGERDGLKLAQLRNPRCKSSEAMIVKALSGDWKPEQLFVLQQSLELYDFYTQQLLTCDAQIEARFAAMRPRWESATELPPLPPAKPNTRSKNHPPDSTRAALIRLTGVDLVAIKGISTSLAQTILSEIGTDMSR